MYIYTTLHDYVYFPTNQTFHQFHDLHTELDLHRLWVVSIEHLKRVWHASRERTPLRTPGSVPHCGTCLYSNCWDQIPRTCHVFTRLFTSNTPWYFLDFALHNVYDYTIMYRKNILFQKRKFTLDKCLYLLSITSTFLYCTKNTKQNTYFCVTVPCR